ncbi:MAG TPA: 4Fe-4S dicluster domain-containing protein [Bacteroidota bacterium]|nr:4Fe-4S dicluster domain-containing protein [Bacteroidota bacterium]
MMLPIPMFVKTQNGQKSERKTVVRRIKYENELDHGFGEHIAAHAYGEKLMSCIQCGTCSATCPLSHYMDYTPRKVIAMTREGFRDEVLNSLTIWLCASCYSCMVQCPRQIHITDVMYALKREAMANGYYPKGLRVPVLAKAFFNQVKRNGRNTESWLLVNMYLRTNPFAMLKEALLGMKLFFNGRMSLKPDRIKRRPELKKILQAVSQAKGGKLS